MASATPQAATNNLTQLGVINTGGSYSVTNKGGGPQLPMPNSRGGGAQDGNPQRHSKLRNGSSPGQNAQGNPNALQSINVGTKNHKKSASRDSALPNASGDHHQKQVKPSELSLDLIIPSSIRGAKQSPISGAHHTTKQG